MYGRKQADEREICRSILRGEEAAEAAFAKHAVSLPERAAYHRMSDDVLRQVVARASPFRRYYVAPIRNPIGVTSILAGVLVLAAGAGVAALLPWIDLKAADRMPILGGLVGLCAVIAAALGWGVSSWVAHRTARAKQTLDIVSARFAQPAFGKALTDFNTGFRGKMIDEALVTAYVTSGDERLIAAVQGMRYLMNYFEFISVGVLMGELGERIVRRTLRGNLRYVYDRCATYIIQLQRVNPNTLEHFTTLRLHYQEL